MGQTTSHTVSHPQVSSPSAVASPPAGCPMHTSPQQAPAQKTSAQCPISHSSPTASSSKLPEAQKPAQCPMGHNGSDNSINPLNNMPYLSQNASASQSSVLDTDRTASSIPRGKDGGGGVWEYPSPQQFHNALMRKGMETAEEDVDMMVQIHNFLNERAWQEVQKWERRDNGNADVELSRFKGRPGELSPKARLWLFAGWLLPSRFNSEPPFDRHDWIIKRRSTGEEVRYVIDYYEAEPELDGSPVFSLDVRPALDSFGSFKSRIALATEDAWANWKNQQAGTTS